jgi:hypothetical protein
VIRGPRLVAAVLISLVAAGLLGAIVARVEGSAAREAIAQARWWWAGPLLAAFALNHGLRIARWHLVLGADLPVRRTATIAVIGFAAILLLPLRLGEVVRPALHARDGVPLGRSLAALLVERLLDLVALLALLVWAATGPELPPLRVDGVDVGDAARRAAAIGIGVLIAALTAGAALGQRLRGLWGVGPALASLATASRELAADPRRAATAAAMTAATWSSALLWTWCGLQLLPGLPRSLEGALVVLAGIMAATTALPTPGFVGSYEAGAVAAGLALGAEEAVLTVFAVGVHLAYVAFVAGVGAVPALAEADAVWSTLRSRPDPS